MIKQLFEDVIDKLCYNSDVLFGVRCLWDKLEKYSRRFLEWDACEVAFKLRQLLWTHCRGEVALVRNTAIINENTDTVYSIEGFWDEAKVR